MREYRINYILIQDGNEKKIIRGLNQIMVTTYSCGQSISSISDMESNTLNAGEELNQVAETAGGISTDGKCEVDGRASEG